MESFTLRTEAYQLRGLLLFVLLLVAVTVGLAVSTVLSGAGWGGRLGQYAIVAGIAALIGLWALVAYARAYTACTPEGIRTRGLAGRRQCRWADVARIQPRPYRNTVTVIVVTRSGKRFRLGVPVAGGVMGDRQFPAKVAMIQQYWRSALTMAGDGQAWAGPM